MQYVYILYTVIFTLICIVLLLCRPLVITLCEESGGSGQPCSGEQGEGTLMMTWTALLHSITLHALHTIILLLLGRA